jgi:hypothetical protein
MAIVMYDPMVSNYLCCFIFGTVLSHASSATHLVERSFSYIIHHYTKGSGRLTADAPDKALMLLRKMIAMYYQGYKEVLPENANKTNPIFAFTSVIGKLSFIIDVSLSHAFLLRYALMVPPTLFRCTLGAPPSGFRCCWK